MPAMVANDGDSDRGIDIRISSEEVVAVNDGARRTVSVHVYHQNRAALGRSNDNTEPNRIIVVDSCDQDFPAISLDHEDGGEANHADGLMLVGFDVQCSWFTS